MQAASSSDSMATSTQQSRTIPASELPRMLVLNRIDCFVPAVCPAGTVLNAGKCDKCPVGQYCPGGNTNAKTKDNNIGGEAKNCSTTVGLTTKAAGATRYTDCGKLAHSCATCRRCTACIIASISAAISIYATLSSSCLFIKMQTSRWAF